MPPNARRVMRSFILLIVPLALLAGASSCASLSPKLAPGAASVCVLYADAMTEALEHRAAEALQGCKRIRNVSVQEGEIRDSVARSQPGDEQRAFSRLRNATVSAGGNTLLVTRWATTTRCSSEGSEVRVSGVIYECPSLVTNENGLLSLSRRTCSTVGLAPRG